MRTATLRAAAAVIEAAAIRSGHPHWQRIADELHTEADQRHRDETTEHDESETP